MKPLFEECRNCQAGWAELLKAGHDFNDGLTALSGTIEQTLRDPALHPETRRSLELWLHSAARFAEFVKTNQERTHNFLWYQDFVNKQEAEHGG